jgi:hypothetical protein
VLVALSFCGVLSGTQVTSLGGIVSGETISLRRRCSHGLAILPNRDVSCSLGFRLMTRARAKNYECSPLLAPKGGSVLKPRLSLT